MRKTHIYMLGIAGAVVLLLSGCDRQQERMQYIGAESAKQLALDSSGITSLEVQSLTADLNTRNGQDYYQVEFTAGGQSYQYSIDALTGVIIEAQTPIAAPESSLVTDADTFNPSQSAPIAQESPLPVSDPPAVQPPASDPPAVQPPVSASPSGGGTEAPGLISLEQAKSIALTHAGLTGDQVTYAKSGLDYENGRQVYEVEFYTSDYKEYDYEIDAYTGEVLSYDYEAESYTPPSSSGNTITAERAKELALAQVPGATASDIWEFKTDYDDGRLEYEGKIVYNGMEYEFEIDGYSGAIRDWEVEPLYH